MMNESVIAFRAFGDGPYGFSFALKRTSRSVTIGWSGCFANEIVGLTSVAAAPAPSRRAKSRREMEMLFMVIIHRTFRHESETELWKDYAFKEKFAIARTRSPDRRDACATQTGDYIPP